MGDFICVKTKNKNYLKIMVILKSVVRVLNVNQLNVTKRISTVNRSFQNFTETKNGKLESISYIQRPNSRSMCSSNDIWKLGRLNHVAIATPNLTEASKFYKDVLRAKSVSPPEDLPEHGVTTVFVELDNTKIELLHPLGDSSPIAGFLKKNANGGIHHVCIEVDDIEAAVRSLKAKNVRCLSEATRIGAHGKPVMFLNPKDCGGVLTELEQA